MELVSVITVSNRLQNILNVLNNFSRQIYPNKELILIFNKKFFNTSDIKKVIDKYNINYKLFIIDSKKTLGHCLNSSINHSSGKYWSKFDDDDYYGEEYLTKAIYYLKKTKYKVIGKNNGYIYDSANKKLYLKLGKELSDVNFIKGPTITCEKSVFYNIKFINKNTGEDTAFLKDCINNNIRIFSSDNNDFIYRRGNNNHTWKIDINNLLGNNSYLIDNQNMIKKIEASYVTFLGDNISNPITCKSIPERNLN